MPKCLSSIKLVLTPPRGAAPCENIFAAHPATIPVAATDIYDHRTVFGPSNSTCIDLWAPGGGLGGGITGASPSSPTSYVTVIPRPVDFC